MNQTLHAGRELVAIPGPSVVPDRVLSAMHRAMPNIYGGELIDVSNEVIERLPAMARTAARPFVAIANGHGAWEMATQQHAVARRSHPRARVRARSPGLG